jgi:hypothetical protein
MRLTSAWLLTSCALSACTSDGRPDSHRDSGSEGAGEPSSTGGAAGDQAGGGRNAASSGGRTGADGGENSSGGRGASNGGGKSSGGRSAGSSGGDQGSGGAASGGTPSVVPACPAAAPPAPTGTDTFVANTGKQAVKAITYTNVGATGAYAEVVDGWSKATGCVGDTDGTLCKTKYRMPKQVSGPLAPFDEEMSMVFAGPVELYQIAVYVPAAQGWSRVAYWDPCTTDGLAFAGNKSWYECAGFVESYVSADGTQKADAPVQFAGHLAASTEVHVMSSALCSGKTADSGCGWSSGLPLHGFKGDAAGSKIFATKFRMPIGEKTPAYWILPSQVIRSSQYGCNCRGAGSDPTYKGGCGELDVAEILGGVTTSREATTTLYSFQDITGGGSVAFNRPVNDAAVFVVVFDAPGRRIGLHRLEPSEFDFASTLTENRVQDLLADQGTVRALK